MSDAVSREKAEWQAQMFVCGATRGRGDLQLRPAYGQWSREFADHPIVRQAEQEGWAGTLRGHFIHVLRRRLMAGETFKSVSQLLPDDEWISHQRRKAARERAGAAWRETNATASCRSGAMLGVGQALSRIAETTAGTNVAGNGSAWRKSL